MSMAKRKRSDSAQPVHGVAPDVFSREPSAPTIYTNVVGIDVSNWDVRFRLGQIAAVIEGRTTVKEVGVVYMSHSHARAFANALNATLTRLTEFIDGQAKIAKTP